MKRIFFCLLTFALLLCPMAVQAAESGTWGDMTWTFDGDTLTISGSGKMTDFEQTQAAPWDGYKDQIKRLVFTGDITYIASYAFDDFDALTEIDFGKALHEIGPRAFKGCDGLKNITLPDTFKIFGEECFRGCKNLETITCLGRFPSFKLNCLWDVYVKILYPEENLWPLDQINKLEEAFHGRIEFMTISGKDPNPPTTPPETTPEPTTPPPTTPAPTTPAPTVTVPVVTQPIPVTTPEMTTTPAPTTPVPTQPSEPEIKDTSDRAWIGVAIVLGTVSAGGLAAGSISLYKNSQSKNQRRNRR